MFTGTHIARIGTAGAKSLGILLLALCLAISLTVAGAPLLLALSALALLVLFVQFAAVFPAAALGTCIFGIGLGPFLWGYTSGVAPKLFVDEVVLLLYLASLPILYTLMPQRRWQVGYGPIYGFLIVFLAAHCVSFALGSDLVALRNF